MNVRTAVYLLLAGVFAAGPACADPPAWAGSGKGKHHKVKEHHRPAHERHDARSEHGRHFSDHERIVIREYYHAEFHRGHCPPGLAKKKNGCMPPGQARKWHVGKRLPRDVRYYEVPAAIVIQLPAPDPGYRYVRVASDILLIAIGSGMVVDAVRDLGGM
jgi:Ni/Co efflux regulator RcnB